MDWTDLLLTLYVTVLSALSVNGLHRTGLLLNYWRRQPKVQPGDPDVWPTVTVQLPMFNERYVAERLIRACAAFDYPKERLEIQVLDDSTDDTTQQVRAVVTEVAAEGVDVVLIHRTDRTGYKAGALEEGLTVAKGELIAMFDADFVPPVDFLRRAVPHFREDVGMVQTRWGHLNANYDWLTRVQATLLDGHFVVEHTARHAAGLWFNFNGTAGIWRKATIADAGGWQHDTLTEDMDLSYRAQLKGWDFVYLLDQIAPAELPIDMAAFKVQQHRWAKGGVQTARKLMGRIWRSDAVFGNKMEATAHLGANFSYPLVVLLAVLLPGAVAARVASGGVGTLAMLDAVLFGFALLPFLIYYAVGIIGSGAEHMGRRLLMLPVVLAIGLGMSASQSRAVWDGLGQNGGEFVRTPKWGGGAPRGYHPSGRGLVGVELLLTAWLTGAMVWAAYQGLWASVPFLGLFAGGYGAVGIFSLLSKIGNNAKPTLGSQVTHQSHTGSDQVSAIGS